MLSLGFRAKVGLERYIGKLSPISSFWGSANHTSGHSVGGSGCGTWGSMPGSTCNWLQDLGKVSPILRVSVPQLGNKTSNDTLQFHGGFNHRIWAVPVLC